MDAEWELVERSKSIDALAKRDVKLSELEAVKREANACFQRKQFPDAVHKYSYVIDCCLEKLALAAQRRMATESERAELNAIAALKIAVRLNRALAHIELHELVAAEDDCSAVLVKQKECVKALYRRSLAREQLGKLNVRVLLHCIIYLVAYDRGWRCRKQWMTFRHCSSWSQRTQPRSNCSIASKLSQKSPVSRLLCSMQALWRKKCAAARW